MEIRNQNGVNVILDSTNTKNSNDLILFSQRRSEIENYSFHIVISDSELDQIDFDGTTLVFEGWLDGIIVINQEFVIGRDCCHIEKLEGPEIISMQ